MDMQLTPNVLSSIVDLIAKECKNIKRRLSRLFCIEIQFVSSSKYEHRTEKETKAFWSDKKEPYGTKSTTKCQLKPATINFRTVFECKCFWFQAAG